MYAKQLAKTVLKKTDRDKTSERGSCVGQATFDRYNSHCHEETQSLAAPSVARQAAQTNEAGTQWQSR